MRIDESPFKCPYPDWVVGSIEYLSFALPCAILFLSTNGRQYEDSIVMIFCLLLTFGLLFNGLLSYYGLPLQFFLVVGSIWMAFQDNPVFGWGCAIFLILLLIPYYHTLTLRLCFALQERKKLRSLVGREGIVTKNLNLYTYIVEIDGEEFDVYSIPYLPNGTTIVVKKTTSTSLDVRTQPQE